MFGNRSQSNDNQMNRIDWKAICNKTKFASHKKRLTKKELGELMDNVVALNNFMAKISQTNEGCKCEVTSPPPKYECQ